MNSRARVGLQALKLIAYVALAVVAHAQAQPGPVDCSGKCGQTYLADGKGATCHCDYWCNNRDDCCGGSANKDAACPQLK
jgi:hypothetical protein